MFVAWQKYTDYVVRMKQNSKKDRISSLSGNSYYIGAFELFIPSPNSFVSQVALVVKNLPASARDIRDTGSIPGSGRSPGGGHGDPLQNSCLENPMDRGARRATVHRVTKSRTWLRRLSTHNPFAIASPASLVEVQSFLHMAKTVGASKALRYCLLLP